MDRRDFLTTAAGATVGVVAGGGILHATGNLFGSAHAASLYSQPREIRSSGGVLALTLTAEEGLIAFDGGQRWAYTYNGGTPGPTLRVKPGDTLKIKLVNKLTSDTNLHTHGLLVSPKGNSDNPFVMVAPGESFDYEIYIPEDHPSGMFWYHPHHHGLVAAQLSLGMVGAIVVEDAIDAKLSGTIERVMVIADPRIGSTSNVAAPSQMDLMHGRQGPYLLVNHQRAPALTGTGKVERWRLLNASATQTLSLSVSNANVALIARDGGRLARAEKVGAVSLSPGERIELLVAPRSAGKVVLRSGATSLAVLNAKKANALPSLGALASIKSLRAGFKRSLRMVGGGMGGGMGNGGGGMGMGGMGSFTFDGVAFDANRVDQSVVAGTVEDWTIFNETNMDHPFHIHAWPYQVVERSDRVKMAGWKDTTLVPANGWVRIRIDFSGVSGKSVYHCHILDHEDAGMMGVVEVK